MCCIVRIDVIPPAFELAETEVGLGPDDSNIFLHLASKGYHSDLFLFGIHQEHKPRRYEVTDAILEGGIIPTHGPHNLIHEFPFRSLTEHEIVIGKVIELIGEKLWALD